ncbi:MAG: TolC family protein [Bacteriovoracaceae bacterium]
MKKLCFLILVSKIAINSGHASVSNLDLYSFLNETSENAYLVKIRKHQAKSSYHVSKSQNSAYHPQVNLAFSLEGEKEPRVDLRSYYGPEVDINYNLLDFERRYRSEFSELSARFSEKEIKLTKNDLLYQLTSIIADYKLALSLNQIDRKSTNSLVQNKKMVEKKLQAGDLSKVELKRATSRLLLSQAQFETTKQTLLSLKSRIKDISSTTPPTKFHFPSFENKVSTIIAEKDKAKSFSISSNQLKRSEFQIKLSELEVKQFKSTRLPTLSFNFQHKQEWAIEDKFDDSYDTLIGLSFNFPLWTGRKEYHDVQASKARSLLAKAEHQRAKIQIENEIINLIEQIQIERDAYGKYKEASNTAQSVFKDRTFEFQQGAGHQDIVLDAQREYLDMEKAKLSSFYRKIKLELRLLWRTGRLQLEDFKKKSSI